VGEADVKLLDFAATPEEAVGVIYSGSTRSV
jgi:hypothetical protein